jgi:phage-related protein
MATQIGPKIGIEGEKEYRQQIQQIINQAKTLESTMNKEASTWTKNTSQMTKNAAQARTLVQQIDLQKQKIELLNRMLNESTAKYGENANATMSWQRAVNSATASLNLMEQELKGLNGAQNFSSFSTKLADAGTKMQNIGQSMTAVGRKMTTSLTLPIAAAATAAVKLASDFQESSTKTDVVFGSMSESVKQFADDALNSYGLAEGSALQMASTFGSMATSMGLSQQQAASMSTSLTALAADMASFYNVSTEVAQTSLQGIFTGETEALKKFGIVMTQTNLEAFAQKQGKVYSQMSEGEKVMTRYAFVMDATKDAQGDFARTSDGTANSLRVFQESLKELGTVLGDKILPIITPIIQEMTKMVQAFAKLPEPVQKVIVVTLLLVAALGPLIMLIGGIVTAAGAAAPVLGVLAAAIGAVAAGIAAGAVLWNAFESIGPSIRGATALVKGAWDILMAVNEKLKNSVNDTVSSIISAFASFPQKLVDAIKNAADRVKQEFENMIKNAKESGKHFIDGFVDGIKEKMSKVIDAVKKVANTVQDFLGFSRPDKGPLHEYEEWMPHFMQGLAKGIRGNVGLVKNAVNDVAKTMALPLDANAPMNMAYAGANGSAPMMGGTSMNVYVDHISELNDLIRIQNQAQQRYRMGAR